MRFGHMKTRLAGDGQSVAPWVREEEDPLRHAARATSPGGPRGGSVAEEVFWGEHALGFEVV